MEAVNELSACLELSACPELSICPELSASAITTTEVVPLSLVLTVLEVALWCVWAAHTPFLSPLSILNSLPPSLSCLLLSSLPQLCHCPLAAPLLTLSPPSVQWDRRGSASLHRRRGWRIPCLHLQPLNPGLRLGLSSPPWPISPPAPPGSLLPPAPPWSVVDHPPPRDSTPQAAPHPSVPLALSGSSIPPAPPWSSVAPAPP